VASQRSPSVCTSCGMFCSCLIDFSWRWTKERYVAVKISASDQHPGKYTAENELAILKHISQANSNHEGWHFIRKLLDSFTIEGSSRKHLCLVFEPLREPLWLYSRRFVGGVIPSEILKIIIQMILQGLDYLHSECQIIHTSIPLLYPSGNCSSD
jgi:serine/threonine-protein kinase SRPK3